MQAILGQRVYYVNEWKLTENIGGYDSYFVMGTDFGRSTRCFEPNIGG